MKAQGQKVKDEGGDSKLKVSEDQKTSTSSVICGPCESKIETGQAPEVAQRATGRGEKAPGLAAWKKE